MSWNKNFLGDKNLKKTGQMADLMIIKMHHVYFSILIRRVISQSSSQHLILFVIKLNGHFLHDSLQTFARRGYWQIIHEVHSTAEFFEVRKFICGTNIMHNRI